MSDFHHDGQSPVDPSEQNKFPILRLGEDPELRAKLERKLEEYKSRTPRTPTPPENDDNMYKIAVLDRLLKTGEVNTAQLFQELSAQYTNLNTPLFENAWGVIEDYITNAGGNTRFGTGLK